MDSFDIANFGVSRAQDVRCEETGKRMFKSQKHAREAMLGASFRIKTYRCEYCKTIHVSNNEKR